MSPFCMIWGTHGLFVEDGCKLSAGEFIRFVLEGRGRSFLGSFLSVCLSLYLM